MAAEARLRNPDGSEIIFDGWTDRPLWSSCYLRTGMTDPEVKLFNYALGRDPVSVSRNINPTTAPIARHKHTNVEIAGQMHTTGQIRLYRMRAELFEGQTDAATPDNLGTLSFVPGVAGSPSPRPGHRRLAALHEGLTLILRVTGRDQHSAPLGYYSTGFGPYGGQGEAASNGLPSNEATKWITAGILIGGQQPYSVSLVNNGSATSSSLNFNQVDPPATPPSNVVYFVRVYLDGLQAVPMS